MRTDIGVRGGAALRLVLGLGFGVAARKTLVGAAVRAGADGWERG